MCQNNCGYMDVKITNKESRAQLCRFLFSEYKSILTLAITNYQKETLALLNIF